MTTEAKAGLPKWAKILIGVVIVGFVLIVLGVGGFFFFVKDIAENANKPEYVNRAAHKMMEFDQLPDGYIFAYGLDLWGIQMVVVNHPKDDQTVSMVSVPQKEKDPKAAIDKLISGGVQAPNQTATIKDIQERGDLSVAGTTMPYVIGKVTDGRGRTFEGMFGCVVPSTKNRTILIYGVQPLGSKYNLATTETLLKSIKSF